MSGSYNTIFRTTDTQVFIQKYFMTAVGISSNLEAGKAPFDLHYQLVNGDPVVRLDAWSLNDSREIPLFGYWVPQGGSCLIPAHPSNIRTYVFTPDFSGCSILVDQINKENYRVYHVQGGGNYLQREYLNGPHEHGLGLAASMTFDDYGDADQPRAFAFLKYENERWWIYYQRQTGVGLSFNNGQFQSVGEQQPRGGGRIPVADLTLEEPRVNGRVCACGVDLPITQNTRVQRRTLPNNVLW